MLLFFLLKLTSSRNETIRMGLLALGRKTVFDLGLKRSRLFAIGDDDIKYQDNLSSKEYDYSQDNNLSDSFDGDGFLASQGNLFKSRLVHFDRIVAQQTKLIFINY